MRTITAIAFVSFSLSAVALQENLAPDKVVQREYVGADGGKLTGLGACSISNDDVSCWNMDGVKDTALEEELLSYLLSQGYSDVGFKFRMKNRFLAVRKTGLGSGHISRAAGTHVQRQYSSGEDRAQFLGISTEKDAKTASLILNLTLANRDENTDVPFREGSYRAGAMELVIGKPAPVDPSAMQGRMFTPMYGPMMNMGQFKMWSIPIDRTVSGDGSKTSVNLSILDRSRKPIAFVDKKGEPVSNVKYLESTRSVSGPQMGFPPQSKEYAPLYFQPGQPGVGSAAMYMTNVNPARIGFIRVSTSRQETIEVQGFPLDPK